MEQHPVPQNVTSFQFRLIGDMTLKQFGYLAVFSVVAYICYRLPFPVFFTLPLAIGSFLFGFGLAFVPIEERPMDAWVLAFIKSIYSPTQYVWLREKPTPEPDTTASRQPSSGPSALKLPQTAAAQASPTTKMAAVGPPAPTASVPAKIQPPPVPAPQPPKTGAGAVKNADHDGIIKVIRSLFGMEKHPPSVQGTAYAPAPAVVQLPPVQTKPKRGGLFSWFSALFNSNPKTTQPKAPPPPPPPPQTSKPEPYAGPPVPPPSRGPDVFANVSTPPIIKEKLKLEEENRLNEKELQDQITEAEQRAKEQAEIKTKEIQEKLTAVQTELKTKTVSEARILELQKQLTDVLSEKNRMEEELRSLRLRLTQSRVPPAPTKQAGFTAPQAQGPTVRVITAESAVRSGLPKLTTVPNVVTGIIKDYTSNLLPGVLVTVRDREGMPLRALKTNKLGQFAASTPLPNNTYFIEVEDPRNRFIFDRIQITLNGNVVPAIEVIAKSEKEISRKKLEQEIFGKQNM